MQMHRKEVMTMYLNLKKEMDRNGVTIDDISKRLDLHRNTVSNKINGITPLSIEEGIKIRNAFFEFRRESCRRCGVHTKIITDRFHYPL